MPDPVTAIVGGASVIGGISSSRSASKAARAQQQASDAAINEQGRQFDTLLNLTSNQRQIGNQALNALGGIYGYSPAPGFSNSEYPVTGGNQLRSMQPVLMGDTELPPGTLAANPGDPAGSDIFYNGQMIGHVDPGGPNGRFRLAPGADLNAIWQQWEQSQMQAGEAVGGNQLAAPDYSAFYKSPDYQFRLNEGLNAVQSSAAARGGLYSGNALRGITDYGSGLAAGEFGNYVNRQLALAGMGQAATTQAGNAALMTGANVGNLLVGQGNARASGIINQGNAWANTANQLGMLYGMGAFGGSPLGAGGSNAMALNYTGPLYGGGLA